MSHDGRCYSGKECRGIKPVAAHVPPYRPPAADDCNIYTFWTRRNLTPGCG
jgi:hypothetical protein